MKEMERLRVLTRLHDLGDRPDSDLVRLFGESRDEAAFELLVRRHGPLVLGVCRRVLGDASAAEDVFQATFLLLARRAPALRQPAGVANWLYGAATRIAREALRSERRRHRRECVAAKPEAVAAPPDDKSAVINATVLRLPEPYRSAVLLCDLSGFTRDQAAAELGVPAGTVASRLSRGRVLLGRALIRQGVTLSAGLTFLVPADLAARTVKLGLLLTAGRAAVPVAVGTLLNYGGRAMFPLGMYKVAIALLAVGLLAIGLSAVGGQKPAEPPAVAKQTDKRPTPAERLARLNAEYEAAHKAATKERTDPTTGEVLGLILDSTPPDLQPGRYLPELLELGACDDEETAVAALSFAALRFGPKELDAEKAFQQIIRRFAGTPRLVTFAREQQNCVYAGMEQRLSLLLVSATDHTARGLLEFMLAEASDPNHFRYTNEVQENQDARRELAVFRYQRIIARYGDVDGGRLARQAEGAIKRLAPPMHLRIGATAPTTSGTDLDGKPMTLADFKGKVVVLEFWGSWCGPCVRATPGLKSVAKEYADRGVVVLGVMAEKSIDAASKSVAELGVPWRNWLDLRVDDRSPIVTSWDVLSFPTTVVIDRTGVVRAVNPIGRDCWPRNNRSDFASSNQDTRSANSGVFPEASQASPPRGETRARSQWFSALSKMASAIKKVPKISRGHA
jgi:RNA polymerase sigma factor (sigma-70 family)